MTTESIVKRVLTPDDLGLWMTDPMVFTLIWVAVMMLVIICPFIATRQRRMLCYRRITERTWNVEGVEVSSVLPNSRVIRRRYPIGDPRHRYTKEDADNETEKFILEKLAPFTKVIDENDFIKGEDDIEMGQKKLSLTKNESWENFTTGTENTSGHSLNEKNKSLVMNPTSTNDAVDQEPTVEEGEEEEKEKENKEDETKSDESHDRTESLVMNPTSTNDTVDQESIVEEGEEEEKKNNEDETKSHESHDRTEIYGTIMLPGPGIPLEDGKCSRCTNSALGDVERQCLSTECSICLGAFSVGDKVSWSALDCEHIFHQECIVEWLLTLGKKNNSVAESSYNNTIMQSRLCNYSMVCPVCRKDFIPKATTAP
eukprot:CAMPEP_0203663082 /NCGR_PEP_ID=MMETSP0090-20130426/811_1 /ASSEMBLY_ACC=CAM_ASM_001088 /TAXON_ID=426623 /ORGANISM="Chaetoceros affinis, Strain CCMP159" /LENGTH=370 /DNA_ID=CAMNT_0050525947 /DNA_START=116 /DNA_END=1228 /DNA_ORIENTATION=-